MATTIWIGPEQFVSGEPVLKLEPSNTTHCCTKVTATGTGDAWVFMSLGLPSCATIRRIRFQYKVSSAANYISQVRVTDSIDVDTNTAPFDQSVSLQSTSPDMYDSGTSGGWSNAHAAVLALKLSLGNTTDYVELGDVGIDVDIVVESLTQLQTLDPGSDEAPVVYVKGGLAPDDGFQGHFYWDSTSTATQDYAVTVQATGVATGRWIRMFTGAIDLGWYLALPPYYPTYDTALVAACAGSSGSSIHVSVPFGASYQITNHVTLPGNRTVDIDHNGSIVTVSADIGSDIFPLSSTGTKLVLRNGTVDGNSQNHTVQGYFIAALASEMPDLRSFNVTNFQYGSCNTNNESTGLAYWNDVTIDNCGDSAISGSKALALRGYLQPGTAVIMDNVRVQNCGANPQVEPHDAAIIRGGYIKNCAMSSSGTPGGLYVRFAQLIVIDGVAVSEVGTTGICIGGGDSTTRSSAVVSNNIIDHDIGGSFDMAYGVDIDVIANAAPVSGEALGTGDGSTTAFQGSLAHTVIQSSSLTVTAGSVTGTDDGNGSITGAGIASGTIEYGSGDWAITFISAPVQGTAITADYAWQAAQEANVTICGNTIRGVNYPVRINGAIGYNVTGNYFRDINSNYCMWLDKGTTQGNISANTICVNTSVTGRNKALVKFDMASDGYVDTSNRWIGLGSQYLTDKVEVDAGSTCHNLQEIQPSILNPVVASGTVYQNAAGYGITLYVPVTYDPTNGAAATLDVALAPSATPSGIYTVSVPAGETTGSVKVERITVPSGWYYSFTATNATIGTVTQV